MLVTDIDLIPPTLPQGFCPQTEQERVNAYFNGGKAKLPSGLDKVVVSKTTPGVNDQDKVWYRLLNDDTPDPRNPYMFYNGNWISPHYVPANDKRLFIWSGTFDDVKTLDYGVDEAIGDIAGPFWVVVAALAGKFPVGVGTVGSTAIAVNGTGGSHEIEVKKENLPAEGVTLPDKVIGQPGAGKGTFSLNGDQNPPDDFKYVTTSDNLGDGKKIEHLPPFYGVYFIQRTARKFWIPT